MFSYEIYNSALVEIPNKKNELGIGFVDDVLFLAAAKSVRGTYTKLKNMMTRNDGALAWADQHNCTFEMSKLKLVVFSRKRKNLSHTGKKLPMNCPPLHLPGQTIRPSSSAKYLGVFLDQELRFKEQEHYAYG